MKLRRPKIILLDLGGVVFQSTGVSNAIINWEIISLLNDKYGYELNIGQDKFPDFLVDYNQLTHQELHGAEFLKEVFDTLTMNSELIEMLTEGSEIVIVSDNYRENIDYISKRFSFDDWAIKQFYSFDYKMMKSNPIFFRTLLDDLKDYDIKEMLFIDDSIKKIESAAANGISSILYQNNSQIKNKLKEYV